MGASLVSLQLLVSSFLQPLFGQWADQTGGGRWMSWSGVMLSGLGAAALGSAPGFAGLGLAMMITGAGTALFHPVSAALIAQAAPPARRRAGSGGRSADGLSHLGRHRRTGRRRRGGQTRA